MRKSDSTEAQCRAVNDGEEPMVTLVIVPKLEGKRESR